VATAAAITAACDGPGAPAEPMGQSSTSPPNTP
jgi:hypothetical protein